MNSSSAVAVQALLVRRNSHLLHQPSPSPSSLSLTCFFLIPSPTSCPSPLMHYTTSFNALHTISISAILLSLILLCFLLHHHHAYALSLSSSSNLIPTINGSSYLSFSPL